MNIFEYENDIKEIVLDKDVKPKQARKLLDTIKTLREITTIQDMQLYLQKNEL